ncbi:MAG: DUF3108 domain-containing protein [Gammaproteobacteria bacterium]|nr:DUF3108 domain-containing protein [Gammaproteobacteria bacterium]
MMKHAAALLTLCLCLGAWPGGPGRAADAPVREFTARYKADYHYNAGILLSAKMERRLSRNTDGSYTLTSKMEAIGLLARVLSDNIEESSVWSLADGRPRPLKYQYSHTGRKKGDERNAVLSFDWKKGIVINRINNDPWTMKVPTGAQDKLLYQYTLMRDLQAGRDTFSYDIADGGELKNFRFERVGTELITTPLGKLETVKLERLHGSRRDLIWCAPALDYLPVRIEQRKNGKAVTMEITEYQKQD